MGQCFALQQWHEINAANGKHQEDDANVCEYFFSVQIHNVFLQKVNCSFVIVLLPYQSDSTYYRFGVLFFMAVVVMDNIDVNLVFK